MSVSIEASIRGAVDALRDRIAPSLTDGFAGEAARLAALLLTISANAVDDAAAIRVAENAAMRALFGEAGTAIADSALATRLAEVASGSDPGLRISELDGENNRLRALLIELHAHVEQQETAPARAIASRIWRMLRDFEAERAPRG